ncbi:unnamed protein product [Symbiodinium sp. CCMP2592]|nr:unnamed protein product [Symbiodinium sp. CCMP2592]
MLQRPAVPGYSGFTVRSTDTNMLSRPYAKGNWEAELCSFEMVPSFINSLTHSAVDMARSPGRCSVCSCSKCNRFHNLPEISRSKTFYGLVRGLNNHR